MQGARGLIDIHNHIIPGLDDGAKNIAQAEQMLLMAYRNGTRTIITTPHYHGGRYKNSVDKTEKQFQELVNLAKVVAPKMKLYLGNELNFEHETVNALNEKKVFTLAGSDYVLVEFDVTTTFWQIKQGMQSLIQSDYKPILAHVERYWCMYEEYSRVDELLDMGIYLQANANSIMGKSGRQPRKYLSLLLKENKIHLVASDAHSTERRNPALKEVYIYITKKYGKDMANDLLIWNPEKILENTDI